MLVALVHVRKQFVYVNRGLDVPILCRRRTRSVTRRRAPVSRPNDGGIRSQGHPGADRGRGKLAPGGPHGAVPHRSTERIDLARRHGPAYISFDRNAYVS